MKSILKEYARATGRDRPERTTAGFELEENLTEDPKTGRIAGQYSKVGDSCSYLSISSFM